MGLSVNTNHFDFGGSPLDAETQHASRDKEYVKRYWRILVQVDQVFQGVLGPR
jgi:hypothetical protein